MKPKFDPKLLIAGVVIVLAAIFVLRGLAGGGFGGGSSGGGASSTAQPLRLLDGSTVQVGGATGKPTVVRFFGTW